MRIFFALLTDMHGTDLAQVPKNFGDRLANVIRLKGYCQRDFARKAEVNEAALSRYINGHNTPMVTTLARLKKAAGRDGGAYLAGETDVPPVAVIR